MTCEKQKDHLFELVEPMAKKEIQTKQPDPHDVETAQHQLEQGIHPWDVLKTFKHRPFGEGVSIVFIARKKIGA